MGTGLCRQAWCASKLCILLISDYYRMTYTPQTTTMHNQGCTHDTDCYHAGDKVHLVHVICNPRANTDGASLRQTPLVLSLQLAEQLTHSQQTTDGMCTCACASDLVPYRVTAATMTPSTAAKRHSHCQHCNSSMLLCR